MSWRADLRSLRSVGRLAEIGGVALALMGTAVSAAHAAPTELPMNYLWTFGPRADPATQLTWGTLAISCIVIVIVSLLVLIGVLGRRAEMRMAPGLQLPVERSGSGLSWIVVGTGVSTLALLGTMIWSVATMASIHAPPTDPALTIKVIGHQWWWELRYTSGVPSEMFTTANEIHIPVGRPVRFELMTADVIHSFWVPALAGKTDLIPNQRNTTWLQADEPGVYRGQCGEYCGREHARMALQVVADKPEDFDAWRRRQLQPAAGAQDAAVERGRTQFMRSCGACHTVRGTPAGGRLGPDLTHVMSRRTIAAGLLPNTPGDLSAWIANPQGLKPGARMPNLELTGPQLTDIRQFLQTLN